MPTAVITPLVMIRLHSRHMQLTTNQIIPPAPSINGPTGNNDGKAELTKQPTINVPVAIHFR